jgi:serine/threonine protein kinase
MLANYDIHEIVAQSPESVVFAGEEKQGGAAMAMRRYLVRRDGERRADDEAAFEAEVAKVRGIEEAHVVGILHAGFDAQDHNPYFVTRMVEGAALTKMLNGSLLAESDARQVVSEALDGLKFLHDRGLVHGGLRADRLIWAKARGVCLMDAGVEPALTKLGDYAAVGEAATTAPELQMSATRTIAGDFFALGACVFELLSGNPLASDGRPRPSVGSGALARWDEWLDAMCALDPAARPATTSEAKSLLDTALAAKPARLLTAAGSAASPGQLTTAAARQTAAPMLVRAKAPEPVVLSAASPAASGTFAAPATAAAVLKTGASVAITGQSPLPALTKPRVFTPRRAAAVVVCLAAVAGAFSLVLRTHLGNPAKAAAASPAAVPAIPGMPVKPPVTPSASAAEQAKAPNYFVKEVKDIAKLKARPDGEPAILHGQVRSVDLSRSRKYIDIVFLNPRARAFVEMDSTTANQVTRAQLQEAFLNKKVKIYGTVEHRATEEGNPNIGVRFLNIADITVEP